METSTSMSISVVVLIYFFGLEALKSAEFKKGIFGKIKYRNYAYILMSLSVIMILGKISKILASYDLNKLAIDQYPILDYMGCFLIAELLNYILHYIKHHGYFWRFHYQHHWDKRFTVLLTAHTHAFEVIFSGIIIGLIMNFIGFSLNAINLYYTFYVFANTYQHSSFNLSLGILDKIIISPAYHRIHHSKSHRANFGSTLTFWDVIFGTVKWPVKNEIVTDIGINNIDVPVGFLKETFYFLKVKSNK